MVTTMQGTYRLGIATLVLWPLCLFEVLTPNTCTADKEMDKSEVYFIAARIQIFSQCRLLVFSQRFVRLVMDLKTNAMLTYIQKYLVFLQFLISILFK